MSENYTPIFVDTVKAAGAYTRRRFIGYDDLQISVAGNPAKGVAQDDQVLNEISPITVLGSAVIEAGGVFAAGDKLTADNLGRAIKAANLAVAAGATPVTSSAANGSAILTGSVPAEAINAVAKEAAAAAGDFVEVYLVK